MSSSSPLSFPPAANWYSSHMMDAFNGTKKDLDSDSDSDQELPSYPALAMAAKGDIVVVNALTGQLCHLFRDVSMHDKLLSVCWSKDESDHYSWQRALLAASTESGRVKAWRVKEVMEAGPGDHSQGHEAHIQMANGNGKHRVHATCWLRNQPQTLVSGDDGGNLVTWDVRINAVKQFPGMIKLSVTTMRASPSMDDVVAVGTKKGVIQLVKLTGQGVLLHRLRCSDAGIDGISWRPATAEKNSSEDTDKDNSLFVVSSKDKSVTVWSATTGRQVADLGSPRSNKKALFNVKDFQCCHWSSANKIVVGGNGVLQLWNLAGNENLGQTDVGSMVRLTEREHSRILHREHHKHIFSIASTGDLVHTIGMNRMLATVNIKEDSAPGVRSVPTFASWIYCLSASPLVDNTVAIGAGDGVLRVWHNAGAPDQYNISSFFQRVYTKITCLAWHPTADHLLAFGTDEGRVGIANLHDFKNPPYVSGFKHRQQVYSVAFAPGVTNPEKVETRTMLYSVSDGLFMMHDPSNSKAKAVDVDTIAAVVNDRTVPYTKRSEVNFHPMGKCVALGCEDGSVEVFSLPDLKSICSIKTSHKLIQCLRWHPNYLKGSTEQSALADWLAVSSNENYIHLFDLSKLVKEDGERGTVLTEPTVALKGHHLRVIMLDWSPHEEGKLVSVSYDGTAQVWDAPKGEPLANFSEHLGRLYCCLWSQTDSDLIYTGAEDFTVRGWKISEQTEKVPKKPVKFSKKKTTFKKDTTPSGTPQKEKEWVNTADNSQEGSAPPVTKQAASAAKPRPTKTKNLLPLYSSALNRVTPKGDIEDCIALMQMEEDTEVELDADGKLGDRKHMGLFYGSISAETVVEEEATGHLSVGANDSLSQLALWQGMLPDRLRLAKKSGQLTDWLVAASASINNETWSSMCEAYALQLAAAGEPAKAASYYLMLHNVPAAISVFQKAEDYKSAVAIAKIHLGHSHPIIKELFHLWAMLAQNKGHFSVACKCYLAAGHPLKCAGILSRRSDCAALGVAASLFKKEGDGERVKLLVLQAASLCQKEGDASEMKMLAEAFPELEEELKKYEIVQMAAENVAQDETEKTEEVEQASDKDKENNEQKVVEKEESEECQSK